MIDGVEELRDRIAAGYEDIRALLLQLRDRDLAATTPAGRPAWRALAALIQSPLSDARAATRLASGKAADPPLVQRGLDAIAAWRRRRVYSAATTRDMLAAWEQSFNTLFSCVNDIGEAHPDETGADRADARAEALAYLRDAPARWQPYADELRAALAAR